MAVLNLDYNLEDVVNEFSPIPAGDYVCKIEECEYKTSSTGKPMLKITWVVNDGSEFNGRKLFDNVVLSVAFKVKQYADLVGMESGSALDTDLFLGLEAIVQVGQEMYEGEPQNKVKKIKALG